MYIYSFEELNCIVACQGSGLFLHTFVYALPTPNRVEATPNSVEASNKAQSPNRVEETPNKFEASNKAQSTNKDTRHYTFFIDS